MAGLYIPTFIANENFTPAKVNPRIFFYNGKKSISPGFVFGGWNSSGGGSSTYTTYTEFPYFDHYSGSAASTDPDSNSESLLFFNEPTAYGSLPTNNLYTNYWSKYIELLYNPKTRFIECEAVIPFAEYINMELNDVVLFKGTHYHLRAINNYNLKTGECKLQLLGPIISDTLS